MNPASVWPTVRTAAMIFLICLCGPRLLQSQPLSGVVRSADGVPLLGVNVVLGPSSGTVTNAAGRYAFEVLEQATYTVRFRYIGFVEQQRTITYEGEAILLNIVMQPDVLEADEVLIEDERATELTRGPSAVVTLEAEDLAAIRGQTLGETLSELPGVTALQTGPSISKPVIRGLHSQRVLVLNAGVSQEGQQWGGEHAPEIDPFAPVRIEVVKGVAGVEYGVGAIGGVIRLQPLALPYLPGSPLQGQLSLNGFSNNLQGAGSIFLEGVLPRARGFGWRVQTSYRKAGDAHTPDHVIQNSAFQESNASLSLGLKRDRLDLSAHLSHFSTELGIYTGSHFGNVNDLLRIIERGGAGVVGTFGYDIAAPKQRVQHDLATLRGALRTKTGHLIETQYGVQSNRRQEFDAHGRGPITNEPAFNLSLVSHSLETKFYHRPTGRFWGVVGLSGMNQRNFNDQSGFLIPNFRAFSGGAFIREGWVYNNFSLEAGARFDYRWVRAWPRERGSAGDFVRRVTDYASFSSALSGLWQFTDTWSIGLNVGSGWRPPSVNELYNFGVHHGTAQFEIGDPDLEVERSRGIDATLRHQADRVRLEFSVYRNRFDGFIYLFPDLTPRVTIRGSFPTFRYAQSDARLQGFDGAVEVDVTRLIQARLQGSLVRGDNLDTNEPLIFMPADRLIGSLRLHGTIGRQEQEAYVELESILVDQQSRYPVGADYVSPPEGYVLFGVRGSLPLVVGKTPVRLYAELHNALNRSYRDYLSRFRYFVDNPGRSIVFRLQVPLGTSTTNR